MKHISKVRESFSFRVVTNFIGVQRNRNSHQLGDEEKGMDSPWKMWDEVEGKESQFEITGNTFEGTFGIATAMSVKPATQTFLNSVLDENTFNGENKIEVYRIDNGRTYYFNEKF